MSSINFNPATRIGTTPPARQPRTPEPQTVEERQLIARLFGKPVPEMNNAGPSSPTAADNDKDDFAPNLGRHLDVLA
ncbi:MAG: hypothetical protein GF341_08370 [candidate division Zixibacteria bacterium]|nr:hypothetical protein [candidate division Zixibacteria bacterium]